MGSGEGGREVEWWEVEWWEMEWEESRVERVRGGGKWCKMALTSIQ